MADSTNRHEFYEFGAFRLDAWRRLLYRNGDLLHLAPKPIEILIMLVDRPKQVLSKEELVRAVWPDSYVEESNLAHNIALLRKTLEDGGSTRSLIETIPKHGYRFVGEVRHPRPDPEHHAPTVRPPLRPEDQSAKPRSKYPFTTLAAVLLCVAVLVGVLWRAMYSGPSHSTIRAVAVLPLENLSGDPAKQYVADAITEALIVDISKLGTVKVLPRSVVSEYGASGRAEFAQSMQIDAFLEGSVFQVENRVRVTAQLVSASTGRNLWAESYERSVKDMLSLQREITQAIAGEIGRTTGIWPQVGNSVSVDPEAYDLYLRGRSLATRRIRTENQAAIRVLEEAVTRHPRFAPASAALALTYLERIFTFAPDEQPQLSHKIRALINRAISLDPNLSEAYLARGRLLWSPVNGFAYEPAIQDFRRAIALNPSSVQAHWWLGAVYAHIGLLEQGFREATLATELNPLGALPPSHLVEPLLWQGRYEQALRFLFSAPKEADTSLNGSQIAQALYGLGKSKDAAATIERYLRDSPEDMGGQLTGLQALLLAAEGQESKSEVKIREAARKQGTGQFHHTAYFIACAYARLNQPERVVSWLQNAADNGLPCYPLFNQDASLDPVRRHPRFIEFMDKMKKQWEDQQRVF